MHYMVGMAIIYCLHNLFENMFNCFLFKDGILFHILIQIHVHIFKQQKQILLLNIVENFDQFNNIWMIQFLEYGNFPQSRLRNSLRRTSLYDFFQGKYLSSLFILDSNDFSIGSFAEGFYFLVILKGGLLTINFLFHHY